MAFRKPRFFDVPSKHFKTRQDVTVFRKEFGRPFLESAKASIKSARLTEVDHYLTKRYWEVVWKSFWQPVKVWAFNKNAVRYYAAVAALGLGYTYVRGIRPDLFGLAPRMHYTAPEKVQRDFDQLKRDLGMEDRNIRLVISRDYTSKEFDAFTSPAVYGSPDLPRGATICLPSVYFEELDGEEIQPVKVGKTEFEWDTLNGVIVRRKLQLPRDELRFVMADSLVAAHENHTIKECIKAPLIYLAGVFSYYSLFWSGMEHTQPTTFRVRFRPYEAIYSLGLLALLYRMKNHQKWDHEKSRREAVARKIPLLAESGANYLDRLAVVRNTIRDELGQYATRHITDTGDRFRWDFDFLHTMPDDYLLLKQADDLRYLLAEEHSAGV